MADDKVSLENFLQGQPTENGSSPPKKITKIENPGYSPVLVTKVKGNIKEQGPKYMEMGIGNNAYVNEELPELPLPAKRGNTRKLHTFSSTKKNPQLNVSFTKENGVNFDEDNYLTPTKSSKRPPISPVGDPQYEELNEVALKIGTNHLGTTSTELPKRKTNMLYEPAYIKKKSKKYEKEPKSDDLKYSEVPCGVLLGLFVIGLLAVLAVVLCVLLISGTVKSNKGCECQNSATTGKVGASTSNDPGLAQRLILLESNLTRLEALEANLTKLRNLESKIETLKAKLTPQQQEIEKLTNLTKANVKTINTLETRLAEERAKRDALNLTVISLTRSQQAWQSATSLVNATLKSDVKDLKIQIANTKTTLNNIESNSSLNFTNLVSKIEQEVTHRRGNDSALKAEIDLNTLKRQGAITNLTRDLALLSTKASQDNKDLETRINNTISGSIMSLQTADQNTFSQVAAVNKTLRNMIMNISLTPGPQGLPGTNGAGNLSRCYEIVEAYDSDTTVPYISSIVPPGYIVTGIFCTATKGARVTSIYDHIALGGKHFKTCRYHRDSSGGGNIQLQSYMWVCPKNS